MQIIVVIAVLAIISQCAAFRALPFSSRVVSNSLSSLSMASVQKSAAKGAMAVLTGAMLTFGAPTIPANAAQYGGFGGAYSEVIDPKDAVTLEVTADVKEGFSALKDFRSTIANIKADIAKDSNTELNVRIKKELVAGTVRSKLNKYNALFGEDTQRGTDRLIRGIIQDLTELDRETLVKAGKTRQETKVNLILKRLQAADDALAGLEAFYPK